MAALSPSAKQHEHRAPNSMQSASFSNKDNQAFYDKISVEDFEHFAKVIGLDCSADVARIFPFIANKGAVMELGAGYGRVISSLVRQGFGGKVYAVERVGHLASLLRHRFGDHAHVLQQDLRCLQAPEPLDAILWLWSGIMELAAEEQRPAVENLFRQLKVGGTMYVETPEEIHYIGKSRDRKRINFQTDWGSINAYFPEKQELKDLLKGVGFRKVQVAYYYVNQNRRMFFMAHK